MTLVRFLVNFCHIRIGKYCTLGLILKQVQLSANEVQLSTTEQHQLRTVRYSYPHCNTIFCEL